MLMPVTSFISARVNVGSVRMALRIAYKQHVIIHFSGHEPIEVLQERLDVFQLCMGAIAGHWTHFEVCLMQCFEIFFFLTAPYHNHGIVMASQDIIYHQSGNASVAVLKGVNAYVSIVE